MLKISQRQLDAAELGMFIFVERERDIQHITHQQLGPTYAFCQTPSHGIVHKGAPPSIRGAVGGGRCQFQANVFFPDCLCGDREPRSGLKNRLRITRAERLQLPQ